jgi:hypothetical protein
MGGTDESATAAASTAASTSSLPSWMAMDPADNNYPKNESDDDILKNRPYKRGRVKENEEWDGGGWGHWVDKDEADQEMEDNQSVGKTGRRKVKVKTATKADPTTKQKEKQEQEGGGNWGGKGGYWSRDQEDVGGWGGKGGGWETSQWGASAWKGRDRNDEMLLTLCNLVSSMAADLRETKAASVITFLVVASDKVISAALEAGRNYSMSKNKDNLPSPHIYIFVAALNVMRLVSEPLNEFYNNTVAKAEGAKAIGNLVSLFMVRRTTGKGTNPKGGKGGKGKGKGKQKEAETTTTSSSSSSAAPTTTAKEEEDKGGKVVVQIAFTAGSDQSLIKEILRVLSTCAEAERRHGKAPAGAQERALKEMISSLTSKGKGKGKGKGKW